MTILIIDHHDSFVYNLVNWFQKNSRIKTIVESYNNFNPVKIQQPITKYSAVIFSPGPGHPHQYEKSKALYLSLNGKIPFLGVCLGYQIMLTSHNAEIKQVAKSPLHGEQIQLRKKIKSRLLPDDVLKGYFVLYNSLGIPVHDKVFEDRFNLLAQKGQFSLAAEHKSLPHVGVQFHPESFASSNGDYFLHSFLRLISC